MLKMTFKRGRDGHKDRWILADDTGAIVAKIYVKPSHDFCDNILTDMCSAAAAYRGSVNARCADKGLSDIY